ncbi:pyruvoyl-dependent arginine decarboxylase (PvlArgDC) [Methylobacterium sp. PvP062]|uniref:Pyruvoyl-dependent arginine decarboxylase (PvlArgDC) n=1 Tax=Methylobacterium radiotolerans TaxID=31998 RepID=A0ABV2NNE4_9HYPH|nr:MULTISPECIES: hypothetical protein [unclassified Methylobacterium]MBP2495249.1 pyruvoyl-dependent arginine decarboxylase (PvlArgDC) [Methylobacterium sp. PvP105]MBP2504880.1 pyruvoyl-dependent arginine decarboxylase (PvlArgDC) [Methylobacterium sp. PvP109]MCX7335886.1 hypothetical protein [Hyphomicrobiales bacterium]
MNAQHPIRAAFGHLPKVAPHLVESVAEDQPLVRLAPGVTVEAIEARLSNFDRGHSIGELGAGISGLDGLIESLAMMAWHVERAVERGAGQAYDLDKLERIKGRIAEVHQKVEISAGRITAKLAGAR